MVSDTGAKMPMIHVLEYQPPGVDAGSRAAYIITDASGSEVGACSEEDLAYRLSMYRAVYLMEEVRPDRLNVFN